MKFYSSRAFGLDGQRMNAAGQIIGQSLIDHAVDGDAGFAAESCSGDFYAVMGFAAVARAGVAGVKVRLIDDLQVVRRKSHLEFFCHYVLAHLVVLALSNGSYFRRGLMPQSCALLLLAHLPQETLFCIHESEIEPV